MEQTLNISCDFYSNYSHHVAKEIVRPKLLFITIRTDILLSKPYLHFGLGLPIKTKWSPCSNREPDLDFELPSDLRFPRAQSQLVSSSTTCICIWCLLCARLSAQRSAQVNKAPALTELHSAIPHLFFFFRRKKDFFFFWLPWVFVCCVQAFSSCGEWCMGFSLRWLLLLRSMGCRRTGFSSCGTRAQ